jgi:hypothetical protein
VSDTASRLAALFPDAQSTVNDDGTADVIGDGWSISDGDAATRHHSLTVNGEVIDRATVAELHDLHFGPRGVLLPHYRETPAPPPEIRATSTGGEVMSNDEYHAHPSLGSTTIKRALTHPERMTAPSGISRQAADEGNRLHCAIIEPEEMHNRYVVAPRPDDYPHALKTSDDLKGALRSAGVKGYSGKKREELAAMVRESIPGAVLWSDILSEHGTSAASKTFVSQDEWDEMHRCADAVMAHAFVKGEGLFSDGVGERSFFADVTYNDPGIYGRKWPMKARPDWLQATRVTDVKSWKGGAGRSAFIAQANRLHYDLSAALYLDVLREHGHRSDVFTWIVVDKSTLKTGGRVIIHTITMSPAFLEQGRDKLSDALDRIHSWETSPGIYNRQEEIEHIAEPPAWGWR